MTGRLAPALLALLSLSFFAAMGSLRGSWTGVAGDEATFLAMAESAALDGDLRFTAADRERLEADPRPGRKSVILQRTGGAAAYSKPVAYPLLAAPFFRLFGETGPVALNFLATAAALGLLWRYLRRLGDGPAARWSWVTFAGTGLVVPYAAWATSDSLQAACVLGGFALCLMEVGRAGEGRVGGSRPLLGGLLLGLAVTMRLPNALLALVALAALAAAGRRRAAARAAVGLAAAAILTTGLSVLLAGAASPYNAVRATFNPQTGYPVGLDAERAATRFDFDRASYDGTKRLIEAPLASAYSALYFLIGRSTGLLLYFPFALVLVAGALRRPDRVTWIVLAGVAALAGFYLVYLPFNYFGGATCIGNRYFLVSYVALPFALRRLPGRPALLAVWALALLTAGSALASVVTARERDPSLLNHAHAGIFRRLPIESTAAGLAGGTDVFWVKEFARFPDPHARVARWSFRLDSRRPPAEVVVANRRADDVLRFLVLSGAPRLDLVYSDWGQRKVVPLESPLGEKGLVEIRPSPPWRYHPLWFRNVWDHGLPYHVRVFRLAIRVPGGRPAEAEVRYLGVEPWPDGAFARQVLAIELPGRAVAGSTSPAAVRVRNTGRQSWRGDGVFPVYLSYRLTPLDGPAAVIEGRRVAVAGALDPGAEVERSLAVEWPAAAGRYELRVDLLIEGVAWFEERVGEPLGRTVVEVEPPPGG